MTTQKVQSAHDILNNHKTAANTQEAVQVEARRKSRSKPIESYKVYIPRNIDLDKLLKDHPLGIPNARDYIAYILHLIHRVPAYKKDNSTEHSKYTCLSSSILQSRIREYQRVIQWLQDRDIIDVNKHYETGKHSRGYKFKTAYCVELVPTCITAYTLIKSILSKRKQEEILQPEYLHGYANIDLSTNILSYSELAKNKLQHLSRWFNEKLTIDVKQVELFLLNLREQEARTTSEEEAMLKYIRRKMVVDDFNSNKRFKVDGTTGRLHTQLTNLKSALRAFLSYDGRSLVSADLKNSQPLLSLTLLDERLLVANKMLDRISIYNKSFKMSSEGDTGISSISSYTMLVNYVKQHSQAADALFYKKLVLSGKIYEHFGGLLRQEKLTNKTGTALRKYAKTELFTAYFSHNRNTSSKSLRVFAKEFPTVNKIFRMLKEGQHNTLACVLQNLEADIVLHHVCKELVETFPEIPLFTIHDSIATLPEYINIVKEILCKHIKAAINEVPEIKLEAWDNTLLKDENKKDDLNEEEGDISEPVKSCINYNNYGYVSDVMLYSIDEAARMLGNIGRNKLTSKLREVRILGSDLEHNKPVEYYVKQRYFDYTTHNTNGKTCFTPKITEAGLSFLEGLLAGHPEWFKRC